jgi:hypothetical protein
VRYLAILLLLAGCDRRDDECGRAFARLARIRARAPQPLKPAPGVDEQALEQCRHGRYARFDPVLRCAMDSKTDDEAASCIDAFVHAVIKPPEGETKSPPKKAAGLNPLFESP